MAGPLFRPVWITRAVALSTAGGERMNHRVEYLETPAAEEIYLIAGWRQWADAGSISSGLPQYLIEQTQARHVASIRPEPAV